MNLNNYTDRIRQVYPELKIVKAESIEMGQNNDVLLINDSLIFRFPKYKEGIDKLLQETEILQATSNPNVQIPKPVYQSFDEHEVGKAFMGYQKIEGTHLWREDIAGLDSDAKKELVALSLVKFLLRLHLLPFEKLNLDAPDLHKEYSDLYSRIQEKLFPHIREDARQDVTRLFEDFFAGIDQFHFEPALIHGDFGASNILWKLDRNRMSGVIDFGEAGVGDPAYDLAGILASYGEDIFKRCIGHYFDDPQIEKRAVFYQQTFALLEALHGAEHNDQEAFANGMKEYM